MVIILISLAISHTLIQCRILIYYQIISFLLNNLKAKCFDFFWRESCPLFLDGGDFYITVYQKEAV